ncbi:hypothetical protein [Falsigemmobacter faecalis]|uniref:Uncharacterized protein n=1 Tax=Falsigemmobacter faecalis TaxID=2488730 RepID=A0A3P3DD68_9RHOB|nr:hypothetical protein [Falsigemmobacter faecalis]RRH71392.1 hypothetical protein EG244_16385 [Falsigemmobacter faecalis]
MLLRFDVETARFLSQVRKLADRDIRTAASWALNDTAKEVQEQIRLRVDQVFDRPAPFTRNAFGVNRGARPSHLEVEIGERPSVGRRHFLKVQEHGGSRPQTGIEGRLTLAAPGTAVGIVPTPQARLDRYGNWSTGERNQVLSQLKVGRDVGYSSNETASSKTRKLRKASARYFVPKHGLAPGVYRRNRTGDIPIRILTFTSTAPVYDQTLGFNETAAAEFWARLPDHLARTLRRMVERRA